MTSFPSLADTSSVAEALKEARQRAGVLKASASFLRAEAGSQGLPADHLTGKVLGDLQSHQARLAQIHAHPEIDALTDQVGFDVAAGLSTLIARCDDLRAAILADLPCSPDGWLQLHRVENGQILARHLVPAELGRTIASLQSLEEVIT
jgi:hypothetical protein